MASNSRAGSIPALGTKNRVSVSTFTLFFIFALTHSSLFVTLIPNPPVEKLDVYKESKDFQFRNSGTTCANTRFLILLAHADDTNIVALLF